METSQPQGEGTWERDPAGDELAHQLQESEGDGRCGSRLMSGGLVRELKKRGRVIVRREVIKVRAGQHEQGEERKGMIHSLCRSSAWRGEGLREGLPYSRRCSRRGSRRRHGATQD